VPILDSNSAMEGGHVISCKKKKPLYSLLWSSSVYTTAAPLQSSAVLFRRFRFGVPSRLVFIQQLRRIYFEPLEGFNAGGMFRHLLNVAGVR